MLIIIPFLFSPLLFFLLQVQDSKLGWSLHSPPRGQWQSTLTTTSDLGGATNTATSATAASSIVKDQARTEGTLDLETFNADISRGSVFGHFQAHERKMLRSLLGRRRRRRRLRGAPRRDLRGASEPPPPPPPPSRCRLRAEVLPGGEPGGLRLQDDYHGHGQGWRGRRTSSHAQEVPGKEEDMRPRFCQTK